MVLKIEVQPAIYCDPEMSAEYRKWEWIGMPIFMHLSDRDIEKGRMERDLVWRQHDEMRTALFKEF